MEQMKIPGLEESSPGSTATGRWERVKWSDVLTIRNGKSQKDVVNENGLFPIYGSGGIMGYADHYLCEENTIVLGRKGSINNPIYVETKFWNVDTAFGLIADKKSLIPKYLYYFCLSYDFERLNTTVTIPSLTKSNLLSVEIPLPPLPEQQRIVARLDKAQQLIDKRKEQLALMNSLVQSLFYEMFGDEHSLRQNYEHVSLSSLGITTSAGKSLSGEGRPAKANEFGVLKVSAVTKGVFNPNENKAVLEKPQGQLIFPCTGDVLVTRANTRDLVAACCVVHQDFQNLFLPDKIWQINLNEAVTNWFFKFIIEVSYIRSEIIGKASGTSGSMLNISQQNFLQTKIPLPPLPLQQTFSDRVQQIESLKQTMTTSLRELELNFQALMQETFGKV